MNEKDIINNIANIDQLKKYAEDIAVLYKSEKEKKEKVEKLNLNLIDQKVKLEIEIERRKYAEEELKKFYFGLEIIVKERTIQLETANHELESFSYAVSHDLRAPLRHIKGFANMLRDNIENEIDEKSAHYLDVITESVEKMDRLIEDLLSFSRVSHTDLIKRSIDLNILIKDVLAGFENEIESRGIKIIISQLPEVKADASMLRVVYTNLISNAIKFTSKKNSAFIEVGYNEDDFNFTFFVRDNGAGFDMNHAGKLFNAFQRLHSEKDFAGTGIGLATISQIVKRHGGKTWAEGKIDNGTSIYFTLPKIKD